MKCARCGRLTFKPLLIIAGLAYGSKCAKKMFVIEKIRKTKQAERDNLTMDLFKNGE